MGTAQGIAMTMDRQRWLRRLPWLVNIVLLLLLIEVISRIGLQWLAPETETKSLAATQTISVKQAPVVNVARQVAQYHLFGRADVIAGNAPTVAPQTKLNLVLRGVIASKSQEEALAIIATRGGDEKGYSPGERLPGGAELKEIYADRVILQHRGRLETLMLERKLLSDKELTIKK